jgi:hypothetical protein
MKRSRNEHTGDYAAGTPMAIAVARFRRVAGLHDNSPDDALVGFAQGAGRERPGAQDVRDVAESLSREHATRAHEAGQEGLFPVGGGERSPAAPDAQESLPHGARDDREPDARDEREPDARASERASDEPPGACSHDVQEQDDEGCWFCLECGEVLSDPEPVCVVEQPGPDDPGQWLSTSALTASGDRSPRQDSGNYEVVDLGVHMEVIHDPMFEDVDTQSVEERRSKMVRYIGPIDEEVDDPDEANDYEVDGEEEILF